MAKKGIAVLTSSGSAVHKLLEDGTAHLGNDLGSCTITLKGSKIELANLDVASATGNTGSIAHAVNAISSSMGQEITDSATRIGAITGSFDDLAEAAFGAGADRGQADYTAVRSSTGVIASATSMLNADQKLDEETVRQRNLLNDLEHTSVVNGEETSTRQNSVRRKIAVEVGDSLAVLSAAGVDNLAEMATSLSQNRNMARDVLVAVAARIDLLDGANNGNSELNQMNSTLNDVSGTIEANRLLNEYGDDAAGTQGTQYVHNQDIRKMNEVMGINADGTHVSVTVNTDGAPLTAAMLPAERDAAIANAANTLDSEVDTLVDTHFQSTGNATTLTMTAGSATLNGSMTMADGTSTFQVPVISAGSSLVNSSDNGTYQTGDEEAGAGSQLAHSGKCFYLDMADDFSRKRFPQGNKFYFCENGIWFPSEMLLDEV